MTSEQPRTGRRFGALATILLAAILIGACAVEVPVPKPAPLTETDRLLGDPNEIARALRPSQVGRNGVEEIPFPDTKVAMPRAGETNAYEIRVTPALEAAYDAILAGDGPAALAALERAELEVQDPLVAWHISALRAQTLTMMGQAADAEIELERTSRLEIAWSGSNLNALALRGEARIWLEDYEGAIADYVQVVAAIGDWRLPISYSGPPTNLAHVVATATAQLRAFTGLGIAHLLTGDNETALAWTAEAERGFNDVHYVAHHYSAHLPVHLDSWLGRAFNLAALAGAELAVTDDLAEAEKRFDTALGFFDSIGYTAGQVNVEGLRSWSLLQTGRIEEAEKAARAVVDAAVEARLPDLVWRIETLRGEALLRDGRHEEAEAAFRRAQAGVNLVSGALATDRAKRRFGVGKNDITYRLARLDADRGDYDALFRDLELGRARAFIDLLKDLEVARGREQQLMSEIRTVDQAIRQQRLRMASPSGPPRDALQAEMALVKRRGSLVAELRARDPELADVVSVSVAELATTQSQLGPGEVIAYALPARDTDRISFLVITQRNAGLHTTDLTPTTLNKHLRAFRAAMKPIDAERQRLVTAALEKDFALDRLDIRSTLFIVPSGDLYFVPWGALDLDYPIVVLPTGGWLNRAPKVMARQRPASILGDPEFGGEMPQLPGARAEATAIAAMYGTAALVGAGATENRLRSELGAGVDVLHFATHARFDAMAPLESDLVLSDGSKAQRLTAARLFEEPLSAALVILSACETGAGRTTADDDLLGLVRRASTWAVP